MRRRRRPRGKRGAPERAAALLLSRGASAASRASEWLSSLSLLSLAFLGERVEEGKENAEEEEKEQRRFFDGERERNNKVRARERASECRQEKKEKKGRGFSILVNGAFVSSRFPNAPRFVGRDALGREQL